MGIGASGPAALVALDGLLAGASIDRLARVCGLSHSGAVRLADRLAQDGLVERRMGADGRSVALALTAAGRRSAARIRAQREAAIETALAPLEAGDRAALARAAELVLAGMAAEEAARTASAASATPTRVAGRGADARSPRPLARPAGRPRRAKN